MIFPFEEISPWLREPDDPCPQLQGERRADVVVIGAGYTGLLAALSLREQGADVLVRGDASVVSADSAIVATNAHSLSIEFMPRKVVPLRVEAL